MKIVRMPSAAIAAVAAVLVMTPASPASANVPSSPLEIQTFQVRVFGPTGSVVEGRAECPTGMTAISGGVEGSEIHSLLAVLDYSAYIATARVRSNAPNNSYLLTVNCANASLVTDVLTVNAGNSTRPFPVGTRTYTCPNGRYAFGGGGEFGTPRTSLGTIANLPTADGHGWTFSGKITAPGARVTVHVRCFDAAASGLRVDPRQELQPFRADEMITNVGNCTGGVALAGGAAVVNSDGVTPSANAVVTSSKWNGTHWQGAGKLPGATSSTQLLVRTLCVFR